jgi:beta-lactamase class A
VFEDVLAALPITATAHAAPLDGTRGVGVNEHEPVTPASVAKVQIALAAERAIAAGLLDGSEQRVLSPERRTPGPTGISLLRDEVRMSVRDLVPQMLTISDNVATDELIGLLGVDAINRAGRTRITGDLRTLLDQMAQEAGFADYPALTAADAPDLRERLAGTAAFDPGRGWSTTAADTVDLLREVWADPAAEAVRRAMANQLTRHRIAAGFGPEVRVAAKSGGLLGMVRNEAGVVTFPDGRRYAVAVFTRLPPTAVADPARIDAAIGQMARQLIIQLRAAG